MLPIWKMNANGRATLLSLAIMGLWVPGHNAAAASSDKLAEGSRYFEKGALDEAVKSWREAAQQLGKERDASGECEALMNLGAAYQRLGQIRLAINTLEQA